MEDYDLCFAWYWEYDGEFAGRLDAACRDQGISLLQVTYENLDAVLSKLTDHRLYFSAFFDRASDGDDRFNPLTRWANQHEGPRINRYALARRAWDKGWMHTLFTAAGLDAPNALILPSSLEQPDLPETDLTSLGGRFAIKPVHGGGGCGVILGATMWEQVLEARKNFPEDQYLLQAHVDPLNLDGRPAWFRVIYSAGQIFPAWWHPATHVYSPLTWAEQSYYGLYPLRSIVDTMAHLCRLELFSTEIALTPTGRFEIVDYINDPIDLRPQSLAPEGIPDEILEAIARSLACYVAERSAVPWLQIPVGV
jgi:hypothetical protein